MQANPREAEHVAFDKWIADIAGEGALERFCGLNEQYENPRVQDYRLGWREALNYVREERKELEAVVAELRHLHANLVRSATKDYGGLGAQGKRLAEGLLSPQIERLERFLAL
ncbi:hypothetical protein FDI24_gp166 [Acidovorax phage ACP17]|uniref:Uncharacterized protein n=1 Tax=Acidovorax phage ACP17 TaxID=2010329 RepID=A0A218M322_9CAUD|nr:hypothetical protein FDI24_gp166 [Acidovorax phage ACP17]ASD50448.1 hypothetical protein [Acidovorax phage ACP17]